VSDINEARKEFYHSLQVKFTLDNQQVVDQSDVVIICVKPQVVSEVLKPIKIDQNKVVISICAGTPIKVFTSICGDHLRVIRVMPNTPMLVQQVCHAYRNNAQPLHRTCSDSVCCARARVGLSETRRHNDTATSN
jgi:pyrroline-5-carboxylate reductase